MDQTEVLVGKTLKFSARLNGGEGKEKYILIVYRNGEQERVFSASENRKWNFITKRTGIYHGYVIVKDKNNEIASAKQKK